MGVCVGATDLPVVSTSPELLGQGNVCRKWFLQGLFFWRWGELATERLGGLPWWLSGQESACQCRRHKLNPWSGNIPHAADELSPCTTTTEPVL